MGKKGAPTVSMKNGWIIEEVRQKYPCQQCWKTSNSARSSSIESKKICFPLPPPKRGDISLAIQENPNLIKTDAGGINYASGGPHAGAPIKYVRYEIKFQA